MTKLGFSVFSKAIKEKFNKMSEQQLYKVNIETDTLWDLYMEAFPDGSNNIFRERREYDCSACKQFIKYAAGIVTINDGVLTSIWDITVPGYYQDVANYMAKVVKKDTVENMFLHNEKLLGSHKNNEMLPTGEVLTWKHFNADVPDKYYERDIATKRGKTRTKFETSLRALTEITIHSIKTVIDLIESDALYRGQEELAKLQKFQKAKEEFDLAIDKELFVWEHLNSLIPIRNSSIGTLLVDISENVEIEDAVRKYEVIKAPANYKRSKAIVTPAMVKTAMSTINNLGLEPSLHRRIATIEDISVNDVLFVDNDTKDLMKDGVEGLLNSLAKTPKPTVRSTEEIGIEEFLISKVPNATKIEVLVQASQTGSLVSLIAPVNLEAPSILSWNNPFSWSYNGGVTDSSIKERVKSVGGKTNGELRVSLSWGNSDDLDLALNVPESRGISYSNRSSGGGTLDVDMNVSVGTDNFDDTHPVENIIFSQHPKEGVYTVVVNNYTRRNPKGKYVIEIEAKGAIVTFEGENLRGSEITCTFSINSSGNITILEGTPVNQVTKQTTVWGITTGKYTPVRAITLSPNHWEGTKKQGNKHYFFELEGCANPNSSIGLYNEFLNSNLTEHRKVFEVLSKELLCPPNTSGTAFTGIGFSSTKRASLLVKVDDRPYTIKF